MNRFRYLRPLTQAVGMLSMGPHFDNSVHRALVAVDITGFGDPGRDDDAQVFVRHALYALLRTSFTAAKVSWRRCHREDRGDGVLMVVPPDVPTVALLDTLVYELRRGLRRHNRTASAAAHIQLRMAVHMGHVHFDDFGVAGHALVQLFRMLEAPQFKNAFATFGGELGLVTSDYLYEDLIRQRPGMIEPAAYVPVEVSLKETETLAWAYFPSAPVAPVAPAGAKIRLARPTEAVT